MSEGCNKKTFEIDEGQWRCERCDKTHPKPKYRYIMSINLSDHTGQLWLSCFDEAGQMIMGKSADDLMEIRKIDEKRVSEVFQEANCTTWVFRCKAKMDTFQEQQRYFNPTPHEFRPDQLYSLASRVRYQVSSASPVNFVNESAKLAELIQLYNID
jgi:replication factor A1